MLASQEENHITASVMEDKIMHPTGYLSTILKIVGSYQYSERLFSQCTLSSLL